MAETVLSLELAAVVDAVVGAEVDELVVGVADVDVGDDVALEDVDDVV